MTQVESRKVPQIRCLYLVLAQLATHPLMADLASHFTVVIFQTGCLWSDAAWNCSWSYEQYRTWRRNTETGGQFAAKSWNWKPDCSFYFGSNKLLLQLIQKRTLENKIENFYFMFCYEISSLEENVSILESLQRRCSSDWCWKMMKFCIKTGILELLVA